MIKKIHLWLSVPFGILITLICFSGAMLVFEKEITEAMNTGLYKVDSSAGKPLPVDVVAARVAVTLPEDVSVTGVTVVPDPSEAYRVGLSKPRRAVVYVNQYTGEVLGRQERPAFFATMFSLHRWLLDSGRPDGRPAWGKIAVGVSTIMFVIALITGIIIWWPKSRKALRNSLKLTVGKGRFRFWHSLHVAGGVYAMVLLLAMALTGLTWSFSWYNRAFYAVFGVEAPSGGGHGGGTTAKAQSGGGRQQADGERGGRSGRNGNGERRHDNGERRGGNGEGRRGNYGPKAERNDFTWQRVYDQLNASNPHAASITIGDGEATVTPGGLGNTRATDRYTFDKATGQVTSATLYADSQAQGKMRGWIFSVHTGSFGGLFTRILWFLAALLGASLPLTGYYLWIRRLYMRHKHAGNKA